MSPSLPPGAGDLLIRFLNTLGIRPIRYGSLTLDFNEYRLAGTREDRRQSFDVASQTKTPQNTTDSAARPKPAI